MPPDIWHYTQQSGAFLCFFGYVFLMLTKIKTLLQNNSKILFTYFFLSTTVVLSTLKITCALSVILLKITASDFSAASFSLSSQLFNLYRKLYPYCISWWVFFTFVITARSFTYPIMLALVLTTTPKMLSEGTFQRVGPSSPFCLHFIFFYPVGVWSNLIYPSIRGYPLCDLSRRR